MSMDIVTLFDAFSSVVSTDVCEESWPSGLGSEPLRMLLRGAYGEVNSVQGSSSATRTSLRALAAGLSFSPGTMLYVLRRFWIVLDEDGPRTAIDRRRFGEILGAIFRLLFSSPKRRICQEAR